jgi:hypothetical protein
MEIVVGYRSSPVGGTELVEYREALDPGRAQNRALPALMKTGMSEETALEQIARLAAGDIWSG